MIQLKNLTADHLHRQFASLGVTPAIARRIQAAVIRNDDWPAPASGGVSAELLRQLRGQAMIPRLALVHHVTSPADGFAKYLFRGEGGDRFEAVRIPILHRADDLKYIVCVSSQAGCRLGCAFCATGRMGFTRNLATWEIVDQVMQIRADSPHPVRGVVFMGMGEPLLNYDAVITAARILSEPCGMAIAAKSITIGTAGILPGIRRFTREGHPYRLVVSLTSAYAEIRTALMPVERTNPTDELMRALREYHTATGQRVTLAWVMIAGVNTREEDARQLAGLIQGLPVKLDLIDVNDPTGRFQPPAPEELNAFRDALRQHCGIPVVRRYSGGADIAAACGMLAVNTKE